MSELGFKVLQQLSNYYNIFFIQIPDCSKESGILLLITNLGLLYFNHFHKPIFQNAIQRSIISLLVYIKEDNFEKGLVDTLI